MVLTSALLLSRTGTKLLNAKVQDFASTFGHTAKTLLNLRGGTGTCAYTKSTVRVSFFSVMTTKKCLDSEPPADREHRVLWPHCDIRVPVPRETGKRCLLLSCYYRIPEGSGGTCEVPVEL